MPANVAVPLIAAGLQAGSSIFGAASQGNMNRKNRDFTKEMYALTRRDSLADWAMQNEYNSPVMQMKRLRDANLNPHLIYGSGSPANEAGVPRSPTAQTMDYKPIQMDMSGVANSLGSYYDIQLKEAQVHNLEKQGTLLTVDSLLKLAQEASTRQGTKKLDVETQQAEFNLGMSNELRNNSLAMAEQQLKKLAAETGATLTGTEIAKANSESSIAKAVVEIAKMRAETGLIPLQRKQLSAVIQGILSDNEIKKLDAQLARAGVTRDSPWYIKQVERVLDTYFPKAFDNQQTPQSVREMKLGKPGHGPKSNPEPKKWHFSKPWEWFKK